MNIKIKIVEETEEIRRRHGENSAIIMGSRRRVIEKATRIGRRVNDELIDTERIIQQSRRLIGEDTAKHRRHMDENSAQTRRQRVGEDSRQLPDEMSTNNQRRNDEDPATGQRGHVEEQSK